jgi:hypothetical protein
MAAGLAVTSLACGRPDPAEWTVDVQPLTLPAGPNSMEPQFTSSDRGVLLSWLEREGRTSTLKFAERTASGWTEPATVASGDDWFLSYADMPSVLRLSNGTLVAQWLKTTEAGIEAYDLLMAHSTDEGKTWTAPVTPHQDGTTTMHGFASMVEMPSGGVGVVWLDGRNSYFDFDDPETGTMMLRFAEFDTNWTQLSDQLIDQRVCECCPTTAVMTADGLITAYRDLIDETQVRDIAVSRLENGAWTEAAPLHQDNWEVAFCPVNGPMLSARGRDVAAAWFTAVGDEGHAYAAFSEDAGRTWTTPVRLDDASALGRVGIVLLDDGTAVATWIEFTGGGSQFRTRLVDRTGAKSAPITISGIGGARPNGYPRIAQQGDELIFAWTETEEGGEGEPRMTVRAATAELP